MDPKELMRLHVHALFTLDEDGRLVTVNDPTGAPAPRFFLGHTVHGDLWWFRHDVDTRLAGRLEALCRALPASIDLEMDDTPLSAFTDCLSRESPVQRVWSGPAYVCPLGLGDEGGAIPITPDNTGVLSPYLEEWRDDAAAGVPMAGAVHEGVAVSICCSVRVTAAAHETGVETHPDFRRRGHARRAVCRWSAMVRELGQVPLYSTSWKNAASRALAGRLGLTLFGTDLHIT